MKERLVDFAEPILLMSLRRFREHTQVLCVVAGFLGVIAPLLVIGNHASWDPEVFTLILVAEAGLCLFAAAAIVPAHGARSISKERETGTWDMLAMTPLRSSRIADQKILAAAMPVTCFIACGIPLAVVAAAFGKVPLQDMLPPALGVLLAPLVLSLWSVEASSDCGRSAVWVAYLPAMSVLCGMLAVALMITAVLIGIALLLVPEFRARAGRMLVAALCMEIAFAAPFGAFSIRGVVDSTYLSYDFIWPFLIVLHLLAIILLRQITVASIESWRRTS